MKPRGGEGSEWPVKMPNGLSCIMFGSGCIELSLKKEYTSNKSQLLFINRCSQCVILQGLTLGFPNNLPVKINQILQ